MGRANLLEKTLNQEDKGTTEDEMVGWNHWLGGHEFEQTSGDNEGQGSLVCYSPWVCRESDTMSCWTTIVDSVLCLFQVCRQQSDSVTHVSVPFQILLPPGLLHNTERSYLSYLCYTVGPCLSSMYILFFQFIPPFVLPVSIFITICLSL